MKLNEIMLKYNDEQARMKAEQSEIEKKIYKKKESIARLNKQVEKLDNKYWDTYKHYWRFYDVIEQLAKGLADAAGGLSYEILGPFGVFSQYSIWLFDEEEKKQIKANNPHDLSYIRYSLHDIEKHDDKIMYRTNENLHLYPEGSIAALNGENYKAAELPDDINDILAIMNKG